MRCAAYVRRGTRSSLTNIVECVEVVDTFDEKEGTKTAAEVLLECLLAIHD